MNIQIPAAWRTVLYVVTVIVAIVATMGSALNLIPAGAVERGVDAGSQLLTLLSGIMALTHISPDVPMVPVLPIASEEEELK